MTEHDLTPEDRMTSLHDRLTDLAEAAPAGGPTPDLWASGGGIRRLDAAEVGATGR